MQPYGDNFTLVIPVDELEHTSAKPFCWDMHCPCKDDQDLLTELQQYITDGLLTVIEANLIFCGRTV